MSHGSLLTYSPCTGLTQSADGPETEGVASCKVSVPFQGPCLFTGPS